MGHATGRTILEKILPQKIACAAVQRTRLKLPCPTRRSHAASVQHWNASRLIVRATGGAMAQQRTGDSAVNVILVGQNFIAATPDAGGVFGAYGSAGFDWQIGRVAWFASGEVTGMNDKTTTFAGKCGMRVVW